MSVLTVVAVAVLFLDQLAYALVSMLITEGLLFSPITQSCSISDVLFTGGRECQILVF